MIDVPKLLNTTYQLKEQINQMNEQDHQTKPFLPPNGDLHLKKEHLNEKQIIQKRIDELEYELNYLKSQLIPSES